MSGSHSVLLGIVTDPEVLGLVAVARAFGYDPFTDALSPTQRTMAHVERFGKSEDAPRVKDEHDAPIPYEQREWEARYSSDGGDEPNARAVSSIPTQHPRALLTQLSGRKNHFTI